MGLTLAFDNDGQQVSIFEQMVQSHPLPVEFSTRSFHTSITELPHKVAVKLVAYSFHCRVIVDKKSDLDNTETNILM